MNANSFTGQKVHPSLINNQIQGDERANPLDSPSISLSSSVDVPRLSSVSQSFGDSPSHSLFDCTSATVSSSPDESCDANADDSSRVSSSHETSNGSPKREQGSNDLSSEYPRVVAGTSPHKTPPRHNGNVRVTVNGSNGIAMNGNADRQGNGVTFSPGKKKTPSPSRNQRQAIIRAQNAAAATQATVQPTVDFARPINVDNMTYVATREFDNEHGDLVYDEKDVFVDQDSDRKYRVLSSIGSGTFGQVVKVELLPSDSNQADDGRPGPCFAIKVIKNKEAYHVQALKETTILQKLNERWDPHGYYNIVRLYSAFYDKGHLMLVFPVLGWNLYELLRSHQHRGFKTSVVKVFVQQVVSALVCLAQAGIVHTDLKPENILLESSERWRIKVIDFGSASYENHHASTYIQSRFYRAPEVILGIGYNRAIDMWSLGCIAAELYLGLPLFPGKNEFNQLCRITKVLKDIPDRILSKGARTQCFYQIVADSSGLGTTFRMKSDVQWAQENRTAPVPITEYFPGESLEEIIMTRNLSQTNDLVAIRQEHQGRILLVDFVRHCLEYDFLTRMTPSAAQKHAFLESVPPEYKPPPEGSLFSLRQSQSRQSAVSMQQRRFVPQQSSRTAFQQGSMPQPILQAPDMQSVIAARNSVSRRPPTWKHKSYDVGQHMRAEQLARQQQQSNQMRPAMPMTSIPAGTRVRLPRQRSGSSVSRVSQMPSGQPLAFTHAQTSPSFNSVRPASSGMNTAHFQRQMPPRSRDPTAVTRRNRTSTQLGQLFERQFGTFQNRPQGQTAATEEKTNPFAALPGRTPLRRSASHAVPSTRTRSNSAANNGQFVAPNQEDNKNATSPRHGGLQRSVSDSHRHGPRTLTNRHRVMHIQQPNLTHIQRAPEQVGQRPVFPRGQRSGHRIQRTGPSQAFPRAPFASTPSGRGSQSSATEDQSPHQPMVPGRRDTYAPYMHQYISARGQQQNFNLGQATRSLRTWQTPQTRYF